MADYNRGLDGINGKLGSSSKDFEGKTGESLFCVTIKPTQYGPSLTARKVASREVTNKMIGTDFISKAFPIFPASKYAKGKTSVLHPGPFSRRDADVIIENEGLEGLVIEESHGGIYRIVANNSFRKKLRKVHDQYYAIKNKFEWSEDDLEELMTLEEKIEALKESVK